MLPVPTKNPRDNIYLLAEGGKGHLELKWIVAMLL